MNRSALFAAATAVATTTALGLTSAGTATGAPAAAPVPSPAAAVAQAKAAVSDNLAALKATTADAFAVRDVIVDKDGGTHVRMDRTIGGLKVLGGDVVVHQDGAGAFEGASVTLTKSANVDRTPKVSIANATAKALTKGQKAEGKPALVIEARKGAPRLAYLVTSTGTQADGTPSHITTTVDALTGAKLVSEQHIETATGDGQSLYSGTVPIDSTPSGSGFTLTDPARGNGATGDANNKTESILCQLFGLGCIVPTKFNDADNHWGNGLNTDRASAAVDAHYGAAKTFDYYKFNHGRNGIFNDGKGVPSRVHYGSNYVNAFWDGKQMTYGDGDGVVAGPLVSIDVAGHEMSHGVTSATSNLTYSGESGGLNEATSDIFGTLVEFYANNTNDPGDYYIGEEIMKDRPALRYMDKPSKDGKSVDCWSSGVGNLDVHYSSGVANHFAYLLAEGTGAKTFGGLAHNSTTCNNTTLQGIGRDKVGKIWYRALTVYMTTSTNYAQARTATLNAASDIYGASSPERAAVAAAWSGVSVN
ncbi:M4 family metallopeptidase [Kribbella sandramycini]|uniref:Neutral metalloproteinase n=1 Tax=Kribbella sandramycini TaxID=60450 RepID=A0A7Y4KYU1_9ACTN|nr:M4 family metallopeptidase [Kribbella sandramycini]MBB6568967.1 Zn-dependent metalloprotease [Kribbella sandramycini]NOL41188.1 M4 family metallopeptidase [Kribbella sandramycini]